MTVGEVAAFAIEAGDGIRHQAPTANALSATPTIGVRPPPTDQGDRGDRAKGINRLNRARVPGCFVTVEMIMSLRPSINSTKKNVAAPQP
jgi:hypothetical protein